MFPRNGAPGDQLSINDGLIADTTPVAPSVFDIQFCSADIFLLQIRQRAARDFTMLHKEMTVPAVHAASKETLATEAALREWRVALPPHLQFPIDPVDQADVLAHAGTVESGRCRLQYAYFETEELILRQSLYMLLNVRALQSIPDIPPESSRSFEDVLTRHTVALLREMAVRHRMSMLHRVRLCLDPLAGRHSLLDIGWLKRQTCITMTLMLLASAQVSSADGASHPTWSGRDTASPAPTVSMIEDFFSRDELCRDVSRAYLDLLRGVRERNTEMS